MDTDVTRGVAWRGFEPDPVSHAEIALHEVDEARIEDRNDAVLVVWIAGEPLGLVLLPPELPLLAHEHISGTRESREPASLNEVGVPPDMIDVQMRADDHIDVFPLHAHGSKALKVRPALLVIAELARAGLIVASARIDKDGPALRANDEGMEGEDEQPVRRIEEVGLEPGAVGIDGGVGGLWVHSSGG